VQGNEYRKTPFKYPYKELCIFLAQEKYFWPDVVANSDIPSQDTCPVPAVGCPKLNKMRKLSVVFCIFREHIQ
jgi:hypothetical protein